MSRDDEAVRRRHHGERVRRREVRRALCRLDARGELTDQQRAVVEALGERLVDRLLAVSENDREPTIDESAVALFG